MDSKTYMIELGETIQNYQKHVADILVNKYDLRKWDVLNGIDYINDELISWCCDLFQGTDYNKYTTIITVDLLREIYKDFFTPVFKVVSDSILVLNKEKYCYRVRSMIVDTTLIINLKWINR